MKTDYLRELADELEELVSKMDDEYCEVDKEEVYADHWQDVQYQFVKAQNDLEELIRVMTADEEKEDLIKNYDEDYSDD